MGDKGIDSPDSTNPTPPTMRWENERGEMPDFLSNLLGPICPAFLTAIMLVGCRSEFHADGTDGETQTEIDTGTDTDTDTGTDTDTDTDAGTDTGTDTDETGTDETDTGMDPDMGSPCETGIYLTVDTQGSGGNLGTNVGPVMSTTYAVHGTSVGNELNASLRLVNNMAGDFTTPQATAALESVIIRCQDPAGANSYTVACSGPIVSGEYTCPMPGCYSVIAGIVKMQIQVDPVAVGQARIGIDPTFSVNICDEQSDNPVWNVQ